MSDLPVGNQCAGPVTSIDRSVCLWLPGCEFSLNPETGTVSHSGVTESTTGRIRPALHLVDRATGMSVIVRTTILLTGALLLAGCVAPKATNYKDYGVITSHPSNVSSKIYPAYITEINGRRTPDGRRGPGTLGLDSRQQDFQLEPGVYKIRLMADLSRATGVLSKSGFTPRDAQPGEITIHVEGGRKYYLGAQLTGSRRDEWKPVLWNVVDF